MDTGRAARTTTVVVTGANKGIGYETAAALGRLGARVFVGSRDARRGDDAAARLRAEGLDAHALLLDVDDDESVVAAAGKIAAVTGELDALVNNAAIKLESSPSPPSACPIAEVRATFETNVFGTIRVIQAMLPLLLRAPEPRIVNVSSGLGSSTLATTPGSRYMEVPLLSYNASKAALNSVTVQFANELRSTHCKVNAADPGYASTDMTATSRPTDRSAAEAAGVVVRLATLPPDGPTGAFYDEHGEVPW
ncbi:MAG TPA: SDR family NAD(P)-dependent oxidoreductase [Acidimicrobiia bacterium]|nr:SDR family NAD(P)-dependent oxidoreductase [Acidimicrobiia bacterium]